MTDKWRWWGRKLGAFFVVTLLRGVALGLAKIVTQLVARLFGL